MEGKLNFDLVPTSCCSEDRGPSFPEATLGKLRNTANELFSINTEEVAALVIDNGYVSPRRLDTKAHNGGPLSPLKEQSSNCHHWDLSICVHG